MSWNAKYASLMFISTIITYSFSLLVSKAKNVSSRKWLLVANISANLFVLFIFKYLNFFNQLLSDFAGLFNFHITPVKFSLLLPIGISFYTFQALSYSIDVYMGKAEPERHFGKYALFVSFFPTLLAGPIQRAGRLIPQLEEAKRPGIGDIQYGITLILWGLIKKVVIADRLAVFVNTVYNKPADYNGLELLIATFFFTFQIYCDFSGYSDMAIGSARILGFDLLKNFNRPYLAKSVTEFWKRWHISLTSWFRDYLYIPLGGNRKRHLLNILIVFTVSGLWHGANITFVVWGMINGVYQIIEKVTGPYTRKAIERLRINTTTITYGALRTFINIVVIGFSWIFFRANNFGDLKIILGRLFSFDYFHFSNLKRILTLGLNASNLAVSFLLIILLLIAEYVEEHVPVYSKLQNEPYVIKSLAYTFVIIFIMVFGMYGDNQAAQFIYFKF
jgi:D-alanyl-lipoteichoic acid acyltransferase DltB (MBOAT superfamily)